MDIKYLTSFWVLKKLRLQGQPNLKRASCKNRSIRRWIRGWLKKKLWSWVSLKYSLIRVLHLRSLMDSSRWMKIYTDWECRCAPFVCRLSLRGMLKEEGYTHANLCLTSPLVFGERSHSFSRAPWADFLITASESKGLGGKKCLAHRSHKYNWKSSWRQDWGACQNPI